MLHIETPLLESRSISNKRGRSVWLKMDALQPSGSFKIRGIGHACETYVRRGAKRFVSSSGGNAGMAVAYAGRRLAVPVVVVVPETTTERAKALIQAEGAQVLVHGASWNEANEHALSLVGPTDTFLHPFDDALIWAGHATVIDECARGAFKPKAVVLSVGGGGLFCGVIEGMRRNGWHDVPLVAVETQGADSFAQSFAAGRLIELPRISSIATSLGARKVCARALELSRGHPVESIVVSDKAAVSACLSLLSDHRILVEPACGAALAPIYEGQLRYESILAIVCGGVGTTIEQLQDWSEKMSLN